MRRGRPNLEKLNTFSTYIFSDETYAAATLFVPTGTLTTYGALTPWYAFDKIVEMDYSDIQTLRTDDETDGSLPRFDLSGRRISIDAAGHKVVVAN